MAKRKIKKDKTFDALSEIANDFGELRFLDNEEQLFVIPTILPSFNRASYIGGLPGGSIIEFYGPSKGGKTCLATGCLVAAQRAGHLVGVLDSEGSFKDKRWPAALGLDLKKTMYEIPLSFEKGANYVIEKIDLLKKKRAKDKRFKKTCMIWMIDSIATLTPQEELDKGLQARQYPLSAALISSWLKILNTAIIGTNISIIFINHEKMVLNPKIGQKTTHTPGGKALEFYAHFRARITRSSRSKKGDLSIGRKHEFYVEKTKLSADESRGVFYTSNGNYFPLGFDMVNTNYTEAIERGIINKIDAGMKCDYNEESQKRIGAVKFAKMYKEDEQFQAWLEAQLNERSE